MSADGGNAACTTTRVLLVVGPDAAGKAELCRQLKLVPGAVVVETEGQDPLDALSDLTRTLCESKPALLVVHAHNDPTLFAGAIVTEEGTIVPSLAIVRAGPAPSQVVEQMLQHARGRFASCHVLYPSPPGNSAYWTVAGSSKDADAEASWFDAISTKP
jgi:hypothetical protein